MTNPLLSDWTTPFGLPPFAAISDDDFAPGLEDALTQARAEFAAIIDNDDAPTFANTIDAMELMGEGLHKVLSPFYTLAGVDSNPAREALQRDFSPKLAAYSSEVSMNPKLFARVETLWQSREDLDLTDEQMRVLELTRRGLVRAGGQLEG